MEKIYYRTNEIRYTTRKFYASPEVKAVQTCRHSHPAGYGESHTTYFTSADKNALVLFCRQQNRRWLNWGEVDDRRAMARRRPFSCLWVIPYPQRDMEEDLDFFKKRTRQVRDALNKCRDEERIEKCAEILGV